MRILVAEDEAALREALYAELGAQGYAVDSCGDGAEALYLATEDPFDAPIVDLGLPGLGGLAGIARCATRAAGCRCWC